MTEAVNGAADVPSDAILINAVRRGDAAAYGVLYERHLGAARRAACGLAATSAERDDLVAEAFTRVLRVLRGGGGPSEGFRPYLLVTMRNTVISWGRRPTSVSLADVPDSHVSGRDDPVGTRLHASVAADAFASLPERWRMVLWHTEVEGESPAEIAQLLGMTPNGVSALAYRARRGLRQAYLEQYLPTIDRQNCRAIVEELPGWVRHGFPARKMRRIADHLDRCADCCHIAGGLRQVNSELPAMVAPIILGAPLAVAYMGASAGSTATSGAIASTASWLTTVKTIAAGAAIVTTTAVGTVASDPVPPPIPNPGIAVSEPAPQTPPTTSTDRTKSTSPRPPRIPTATPPAAPTSGDTTTPDQTTTGQTKEAKHDKKAAKQAEKAAKQEDKKAKKESKSAGAPPKPEKKNGKR